MNEIILEKNHMNVSNVVKPSVVPVLFEDMKGPTPQINNMNVNSVTKPSVLL